MMNQFCGDCRKEYKANLANCPHCEPAYGPGGIYHLALSTRAWHCLVREGLFTVAQVNMATDKRLLKIDNMGKVTIREVRLCIERTSPSALAFDCRPNAHRTSPAGITIEKDEWVGAA
jgi:DNA-directed RNA polymerase alpha subunit